MKFFSFASVALAAFTGLVAAIDPATVVNNINALTDLSSQTNQMVSSITVVNVLFKGPQVGQTLAQIVNVISTDVSAMLSGNTPPFADDDAELVVQALTAFVKVHQALLNTIIGKHGILSLFFFTQPVAAALRSLEGVVDSFAFALINLIPTKKTAANDQFGMLSATLSSAMTTYQS